MGGFLSPEDRGGFGGLLRRHRLAAGLTQQALADQSGLSVRGIADLERGVRRFPHFHTVRCLAQALDLTPAERVALVAAGRRPEQGLGEAESSASEARRCGGCGRKNAPDARFCVDCGDPLALVCPACGAVGDPSARFCHACGASRTAAAGEAASAEHEVPRVAADGEQKQATILFCQLADPTVLTESMSQEQTLAFLDSFFELATAEVRRFEGTISSFLNDGFVALFGVPVAHEDHARRGVLAAIGLQRALGERAWTMVRA